MAGEYYPISSDWSTFINQMSIENIPGPPTGLRASAVSSTQINLSWTTPYSGGSPITGYKMERESPPGGGFTILDANTGSTATTFNDSGLSANTRYNYRVSAINSLGTSLSSNQASATTMPTSCLPPVSGDWTVSSSCTLSSTPTAPANVIVQSGTVLTIPNGFRLNIDLIHHHLFVKSGGGVLIKAGGAIN
jgi:chitodextrinase